jgi:hypothetical protein
MAEDRIITKMTIPRDRTAPSREPWPEIGTALFADDPAATRDHGSFDGPITRNDGSFDGPIK